MVEINSELCEVILMLAHGSLFIGNPNDFLFLSLLIKRGDALGPLALDPPALVRARPDRYGTFDTIQQRL